MVNLGISLAPLRCANEVESEGLEEILLNSGFVEYLKRALGFWLVVLVGFVPHSDPELSSRVDLKLLFKLQCFTMPELLQADD